MTIGNWTKTYTTLAALAAWAIIASTAADAAVIGHWKFDEDTGLTAADSSPNGNLATTTADSWTTGISGSAAALPRYSLADSSDLVLTGPVQFSLSLWAKPNAAHGFTSLAGFEGTGSTGDSYAFKTNGSDALQFTPSNIVTPDTLMNYSNGGADWVHVVGVHNPGTNTSTIYINGVSVATGSAGGIPARATNEWRMGRYWNSTSYNYNGSLDEVQVYDEALTASHVSFLFNNPTEFASVTPEPTTVALLLVGIAFLRGGRRFTHRFKYAD